MSRTIINVDDELLSEAAQILGTTTKTGTVNSALEAVVKQQRRREFARWIKDGGLPDLSDPYRAGETDAA